MNEISAAAGTLQQTPPSVTLDSPAVLRLLLKRQENGKKYCRTLVNNPKEGWQVVVVTYNGEMKNTNIEDEVTHAVTVRVANFLIKRALVSQHTKAIGMVYLINDAGRAYATRKQQK